MMHYLSVRGCRTYFNGIWCFFLFLFEKTLVSRERARLSAVRAFPANITNPKWDRLILSDVNIFMQTTRVVLLCVNNDSPRVPFTHTHSLIFNAPPRPCWEKKKEIVFIPAAWPTRPCFNFIPLLQTALRVVSAARKKALSRLTHNCQTI
jgi:hypothetical protein